MNSSSTELSDTAGVQHDLERQYVPTLQMLGMSEPEAQRVVSGMLEIAKLRSAKEGTDKIQRGFGDFLVQHAKTCADVPDIILKLRQNGVTDEDIRWWWNMHDLERRMMVLVDDMTRTMCIMDGRERLNLSEVAAVERMRSAFPMFGDPDDTTHTQGDNRPVPLELKARINAYIQRRNQGDVSLLQRDMERFSTFNALVRDEMRRGKL